MKLLKLSGLAVAVVMAAGLAGCHHSEPVHTVDWYRAHKAERVAQVAACKEDPGELAKTPNCVNAQRAAWLEDSHAPAFHLK